MIEYVLVVVMLIVFIALAYLMIRNTFVYNFKMHLSYICHSICKEHISKIYEYYSIFDYDKDHEKLIKMLDSMSNISYEKMLYSFKPLKPKYWLNEEQMKFIENAMD